MEENHKKFRVREGENIMSKSIKVFVLIIIGIVFLSILFTRYSREIMVFDDSNFEQGIRDALRRPTGNIYKEELMKNTKNMK